MADYSSRSNARRAAKAAGEYLDLCEFYELNNGRWAYEKTTGLRVMQQEEPETPVPTYQELDEVIEKELAAPVETPVAKGPTYKELYNTARSATMKPVEYVHRFLNEHGAELPRKLAVAKLIEMGVNYSTARTQYQRWHSARKG